MSDNSIFWEACATYYFTLSLGIALSDPVFLSIAGILFVLIPSVSNIELIPGVNTSIEAQLETLKTQMWLSREGYYG